MVRMSLLGGAAGLMLTLVAGTTPALAMPMVPGLATTMGQTSITFERVAYDPPRRPYCKLESQRHFQNWNPGRFDEWNGIGPYKHKHFGGHRWHDLNYNGCAPWWQPEADGTTAARRAFKQAYDNLHVRWCFNRYNSYDPSADSYTTYDGRQERCVGPNSKK